MVKRRLIPASMVLFAILLLLCGCRERHICAFDVKNTDERYLYESATCESRATYYYSCACGKVGTEIFETQELGVHDYSVKNTNDQYLYESATCQQGASYYYSCACGAAGTEIFETEALGSHDYSAKNTDDQYLHESATCQHGASYYYSCECGAAGTEIFETEDLGAHDYSVKNTDEQYLHTTATCQHGATYYYSCECGAVGTEIFESKALGSHDYSVKNTDKQYLYTTATCQRGATYYYSCACGAVETKIFETEALGAHDYSVKNTDEQYLHTPATCQRGATYYYSCECGAAGTERFTTEDLRAHDYSVKNTDEQYLYESATCQHGATYYYSCACGAAGTEWFTTEELGTHDYSATNTEEQYLKTEGNCQTRAEYYYSCRYCGEASDQTAFLSDFGACRFENQLIEERYLKSEATPESPTVYYKSCVLCGEAGDETFLYGVKVTPALVPRDLGCQLYDFRKDEYEFTWITDEMPARPRLQIAEGTAFDPHGKYKQYSASVTRNPDGDGYLMSVKVDLDYSKLYTYRAYDGRSQMASEPITVWTKNTTSMAELYLLGATGSQMLGCVVLTKNHTIVFDGGSVGADGEQLANFLKENADSKVDAWFFTHPHSDHLGAFCHTATNHPEIEIDKIYHHFPSIDEIEANRRSDDEADTLRNATVLFETRFKDRVFVTQTNEIFTFDRIKVKVLRVYNPELINANFTNESSSVYRVKSPQSSLLILGDLGTEGGDEVMQNCSLKDLKTEYTQMAHHGQGGVTREFYEYIEIQKCLWPTPDWLWDNNLNGQGYNTGPWSTLKTREWMAELGVTTHYVAKDGTQKIDF